MKTPRAPIGKPTLAIAALMPHAPILVRGIADQYADRSMRTTAAMREAAARIVRARPDCLLVVSPHASWCGGTFGIYAETQGSLSDFGAPDTSVALPAATPLARQIETACKDREIETWSIPGPLDHGAVVPLIFLAEAGWTGKTTVLGLSPAHRKTLQSFGEAISDAIKALGQSTALVASGDMSHRLTPSSPCGHDSRAHQFDETFIAALRSKQDHLLWGMDANLRERAGEDALDPALVAVFACGSTRGRKVLSYDAPFGVGYGVAILFENTSPAV